MADRIQVEDIQFHGLHGVMEEERRVGHRFRVDVTLELDLQPAGLADDFRLTVDYAAVARSVVEIGTGPSVQLVETLAERMAARVLEEFPPVDAVEMRVAKIHPPVALHVGASIVTIRRTRARKATSWETAIPLPKYRP